MTDKVEHRFVEIQRCTEFIPEKLDALWHRLGQGEEMSLIGLSYACSQLQQWITHHPDSLETALQQLQNAIVISQDAKKDHVLVSCLFALLRQCDAPGRRLVSVVLHRPELFRHVLTMAQQWLAQDPDAFDRLAPWFDVILLAPHGITSSNTKGSPALDPTTLLYSWTRLPVTPARLAPYLERVCQQYPWHYPSESFVAVLHTLMNLHPSEETISALVYQTLQRAVNDANHNQPVDLLLTTLLTLLDHIPHVSLGLMMTGLSSILMTACTVDDQVLTLQLMKKCLDLQSTPIAKSSLYWIALLPLFQTLSECQHGPDVIRSDILRLMDSLPSYCHGHDQDHHVVDEMCTLVETHGLTGPLAHAVAMASLYIADSEPVPMVGDLATLLMSVPGIFSHDHATAVHATQAVVCQANQHQPSPKWPVLLILMYLIRQPDLSSKRLLPTLMDAVPALAHPNDPVITTKTLQLTLTMIQYQPQQLSRASTTSKALPHLGINTLTRLFDHQPRIWQELRKILADWVLRQTSKYTSPSPGDLQADVAILTTMRHLCQRHADLCASDILPMIIAWLQSARYVHPATLSLAVQIMMDCVAAGLAEPRSLWLVSVSHLATLAQNLPNQNASLLIRRLCEWMGLAAEKTKMTEHDLEFVQTILSEYLVPWTQVDDEKVCRAAFLALARFPMADVMEYMPEKPKDLLLDRPQYLHTMRPLLQALVSHELDHLQRRLFEAAASKDQKKTDTTSHTQESTTPTEDDLARSLIRVWEQANVAPGLRSGYAIATLQAATMAAVTDRFDQHQPSPADLSRTKWYRCMNTGLIDIALTDHLLVRLSSPRTWHTFFTSVLQQDAETRGIFLFQDLMSRLEKSTLPGLTCNLWMALTGLMSALYQRAPSKATSLVSDLWRILTTQYLSLESKRTSEEVQYGARYCLGQLANYMVVDDKLIQQLWDTARDLLQRYTESSGTETALDLTGFATGHAVGTIFSTLTTWPTPTTAMGILSNDAFMQISNDIRRLTSSAALGVMLACAPFAADRRMHALVSIASGLLDEFIQDQQSVNHMYVYGSLWVGAYASHLGSAKFDDKLIQLVNTAGAMASNMGWAPADRYHIDMPMSIIAHQQALFRGKDESQRMYQQLQTVQTDALQSPLAIGPFLGVDFLHPSKSIETLDVLAREADHYQPQRPAVQAMAAMAGLQGDYGQLKQARLAAVLCGLVLEVTADAQQAKEQLSGTSSTASSASAGATHIEPSTYQRLNNNTSYLRAIFDTLASIADDTEHALHAHPDTLQQVVDPLLICLKEVPGPLPPVNWFPVLRSLSRLGGISSHLVTSQHCFDFAAAHASTSSSLCEYLVQELTRVRQINNFNVTSNKYPAILLPACVGPNGFGKLLALSGLAQQEDTFQRRGMAAITKKIAVSPLRTLSILLHYIQSFWHWPVHLQERWLTTVQQHVTITPKDEQHRQLIRDIQDKIRDNLTDQMLAANTCPLSIVKLSAAVSLRTLDDLLQGQTLSAWLKAGNNPALVAVRTHAVITLQPSKLTEVLTVLAGMPELPDDVWTVMYAALSSQVPSERLGWVIRLLDVLIVAAVSNDTMDVALDPHFLYVGLSALWSASQTHHQPLIAADTSYFLSASIYAANNLDTEQQLMRRLIKLAQLLPECSIKAVIVQSLRGCPQSMLQRHWDYVQEFVAC
ncbi:hypothetical protein DM01DRAFT_1405036 [Hesseltinella vesiculosa]|uniref:DUF3730 domain-containing protein n=1 Tax=Hesseltinella vesiculosa TaxID=101127 RepID=A0A1X2GQW7_9FUNG|nr:hypothetical protein DM01DRAFT_1405036 [Hesseltinella vesiculosa]